MDNALLHGYEPSTQRSVFKVAEVVTQLGSPGVVIVLGFSIAALIWFRQRNAIASVACILAPGAAGIAETLGKAIVQRHRPIAASLTGESGVGFPSGHAAGFTALAIIAAVLLTQQATVRARRFWMLVAVAASLVMAITRVAVGAHYPTDVLAGMLVGVICAELSVLVAPFVTNILVTNPFISRLVSRFASRFVSRQKPTAQKAR